MAEKPDKLQPIPPESIPDFLADKPYVRSATDFCLGKTWEEIGSVIRELEEKYGVRERSLPNTDSSESVGQ